MEHAETGASEVVTLFIALSEDNTLNQFSLSVPRVGSCLRKSRCLSVGDSEEQENWKNRANAEIAAKLGTV